MGRAAFKIFGIGEIGRIHKDFTQRRGDAELLYV